MRATTPLTSIADMVTRLKAWMTSFLAKFAISECASCWLQANKRCYYAIHVAEVAESVSISKPQVNGSPAALARRLKVFDATMLVMGGTIGSGIFMNPSFVAR